MKFVVWQNYLRSQILYRNLYTAKKRCHLTLPVFFICLIFHFYNFKHFFLFFLKFVPKVRSDVDRYISKTYHEALHYVKPDVIIFLGDLIDEGSVAGEQEFKDYVRRFYNIFNIKKNHDIGEIIHNYLQF